MKITIIIGPFNPVPTLLGGAVEGVHWVLARKFAERGHEVVVISRMYEKLPPEEVIEGVRMIRVPSWDAPRSRFMYRFLDYVYSLRARRALPQSDITITNSVFLPLVLSQARAGKIYVHAARFPKRQMGLYRRAARIQTVSQSVARVIGEQTPSVKNKIVSIPNPLAEAHSGLPPDLATPRSKTILYVGRIAREKGVHILVNTFSKLASGVLAGYELRIIGPHERRQQGDGPEYLQELRTLAKGAEGQIFFDGPIFDSRRLRQIYLNTDIFVYPSIAEKGETFGLAPLEAMAAGCCCVISSLECFREYAVPGENCIVFDHRANPQECLAKALTNLVTFDRYNLRQAAVETARSFHADAIADAYLRDFCRLLSIYDDAPVVKMRC